jgi:hypothetical protein
MTCNYDLDQKKAQCLTSWWRRWSLQCRWQRRRCLRRATPGAPALGLKQQQQAARQCSLGSAACMHGCRCSNSRFASCMRAACVAAPAAGIAPRQLLLLLIITSTAQLCSLTVAAVIVVLGVQQVLNGLAHSIIVLLGLLQEQQAAGAGSQACSWLDEQQPGTLQSW